MNPQKVARYHRNAWHGITEISINNGKGKFDADCIAFAPYPATTIFPGDFNKDGYIDLVVPYRDKGQSYVYFGSEDNSYLDNQRVPFGPTNATIRVAAAADFNNDGMFDVVSVDENRGVYLYSGQENKTFASGISLADSKIVPYALAIADMNGDQRPDIIVGHKEAPSTVFFNEGTNNTFKPISFGDAKGTAYGFAIGDFNEDGTLDIATARSDAPNVLYFGNFTMKIQK